MDLRYKKYVGKTTFFFAIFLHKIIPFTNDIIFVGKWQRKDVVFLYFFLQFYNANFVPNEPVPFGKKLPNEPVPLGKLNKK